MVKFLKSALLVVLFLVSSLYLFNLNPTPAQADTHNVSLSTTVQSYLTFDITSGDSISFGSLTPGTPICEAGGSVASVTTNAANGYTLGVHDTIAAPNSSLLHAVDATTRIPKMTNGTIATPLVWGSNYGVGVGLFAADTNKEAKWGTGTTVCDANNKYAAVPETLTTAHTVTGFHSSADTSSWSWKIDVQNTQKTGSYSGVVVFTATAVLS